MGRLRRPYEPIKRPYPPRMAQRRDRDGSPTTKAINVRA